MSVYKRLKQIMEEEKVEETIETPEEKTGEEAPKESSETQDAVKQAELEEKNKQLFARAKSAEEKAAKLQKLIDANTASKAIDPVEIASFTSAVKDYSVEELEFIVKNATDKSTKGIIEASKDEMVQMAIEAKRTKVAEEKKALATSNKQKDAEKPKSLDEKLTQAASNDIEELGNLLREKGLYKDPHRRPDRVQIK